MIPPQGVRDARTHLRLARMLGALMEQSELNTEQLQAAAGLGWRAGCRMALELLKRGLTVRERRGRFFYHRLTRAARECAAASGGGATEGGERVATDVASWSNTTKSLADFPQ